MCKNTFPSLPVILDNLSNSDCELLGVALGLNEGIGYPDGKKRMDYQKNYCGV